MAEGMLESTGNPQMDSAVENILGRLVSALPGRLRAVYVLGSYADASAVTTSDLDLVFIIAHRFGEGEHDRVQAFLTDCASLVEGELDIQAVDEEHLRGGITPTLKQGSRLLWGADVCRTLPLVPLAAWTRDRMHTSYWRVAGLFSRPLPLTLPLAYPDSEDEFFGYTRRLTYLPGGELVPGTRDLMRAVGWMATALLGHQAGQYVSSKRDCATMYRHYIGDEWANLLDDLAEWVRGAWHYRIPGDQADRARLRAICARTLAFENHFLALYRRYVLAELRSDDTAARQSAVVALRLTPLADAEVVDAVADAERR